jgi:tetratricopeptide (TPR) repeat protein
MQGKLGSAEQSYNLAISLNPDNVAAHYNLGTLYEDIQEFDQAETQYLIAARGDFPEAYNNLARLYLQPSDNSVNKSLALLSQGLRLAEAQQSFPETRFSLYKNLGWALFQQAEYPFAADALEEAISIYEQLPSAEQEYVANPGSAYCLVAQVREAMGQTDVLPAWQRCCQLGDRSVPEENAWLTIASDRFETAGLEYKQVCHANALPL